MASTLSRLSSFTSTVEHDIARVDQDISARGEKLLQKCRESVKNGGPIADDIATVEGLVDLLKHPNGIDDRKMLLEHILIFLSTHSTSALGAALSTKVVELLYNDLPHPPLTYIGNEYAWRTADGSNNNASVPDRGKAGTPYARTVQQTHPLPQNELPDAGLVFDTLLRREAFVKHPAGLSSMMFSFAALVIHSIFRTSHENVNINETSSYVDLAPLYGNNQDTQDKIRVRNGRGLIYPDTFAEDRLLLLPPAVCVLLVMFNRNHNYIAKMLLELNERGTYVDPDFIPSEDPKRASILLAQDEEIFQTARLINCGWFASVVFSDYFSAILGLVRDGNSWSLDPFGEIRDMDHSLFERGRGNVCSIEFNCLYRWHATTSQHDEQWIETLFGKFFPGKTWNQISISDFKKTAKDLQALEPDITHWTFGSLKRQADGSFNDADLAAIIQTATQHPAAAFKARGTPHVMRLHEIMGIESNRKWGCCSLNDFRQFIGLKRYSSFLEWNPDPEVAAAAEKLYGDIDRLELYVGLQAEAAKPVMEGAGLCPSYTISRAILSDAIALTRGDRFFTADYTPYNLTSWGFADCQRDPDAPGYGSMLGKLFLRTLPNHFTSDSTYTWFPLMTPEAIQTVLTKLGDIQTYSLAKPGTIPPLPKFNQYLDVAKVLGNPDQFSVPYASRAGRVVTGQGFFIASDDPARAIKEQSAIVGVLSQFSGKIMEYFYQKTQLLMQRESYTSVGTSTRNVDIVRDVLKYIPIHWASSLAGIRLKAKADSKDGDYTPQELFDMLSDIYSFLFLDVEASKLLNLQRKVKTDIDKLLQLIKAGLRGSSRLSIIGVVESIAEIFLGREKSDKDELIESLTQLGFPTDTLANSILAVLVGATVEMSQSIIHVVNFYLDENKPRDVQSLAAKIKLSPKDENALGGYVREALRLDPPFRGVYRQAVRTVTLGKQAVPANTTILLDIADASLDAHVFVDPTSVNPTRSPTERYLVGDGSARCLGTELSTKIIGEVVRAVFEAKHIRRAPGQSGMLKRFKTDLAKTSTYLYLSSKQELVPWASSMAVQFD
ncbi:linoleate diol synthase [Laetiporus sulphureus 93-53]|uniref:Linoleate diol synthase n=1 Tax=Laetiporus sulphureus 93-53 TaxID=1314785 RepID=A0A165GBX7_9APHY|nr:linoleate diol synthase [Laetiporus sulphureus 93-53]KZT10132.1 linoleate diol synthase [Laetiporus sulphureus 93-53]